MTIPIKMKLPSYLLIFVLVPIGCAIRSTAPNEDRGTKLSAAVTAPLEDLNLIRTKIPEVLTEAGKHPYLKPSEPDCDGLSAEITELNTALGPDLDRLSSDSNNNLLGKGGELVENSAIDAIRSTTRGVIPFIGWVRKLTGAERHSKEVRKAIAAGIVRRAYLKGIGESLGCEAPAAPLPQVPDPDEATDADGTTAGTPVENAP